MRTTVSTKGQIILPAEIRREDDIKPGQEFEIQRIDRGEYLFKRKTKPRN
jgi:AbrB family looped-hinge helix DNA binding protein